MEITQALLRDTFDYRDGSLVWRNYRAHNARKGDVAGYVKDNGYLYVSLTGGRYLVHRLVFLMHHGYLPEQVDHINMDRLDNRIENLRAASSSQNKHNTKKRSNNTSGYKGAYWDKKAGKWKAMICKNYKQIWLGHYATAEEAAEAYRKAAELYHGEFARAA